MGIVCCCTSRMDLITQSCPASDLRENEHTRLCKNCADQRLWATDDQGMLKVHIAGCLRVILNLADVLMASLECMIDNSFLPLTQPTALVAHNDEVGGVGVVVMLLAQVLAHLQGVLDDVVTLVYDPARDVELEGGLALDEDLDDAIVVDVGIDYDAAHIVSVAFSDSIEGSGLDVDNGDLDAENFGKDGELDVATPGLGIQHSATVCLRGLTQDDGVVLLGVGENVAYHNVTKRIGIEGTVGVGAVTAQGATDSVEEAAVIIWHDSENCDRQATLV